ncbi:hypothetical protein BV22DRAFT_1036440 [Leucogyrophana mollusca]|uniref:Uncharacterized protein n=1 Tax=Leucogyrophana mollusca TaxID=85980 RepID=A0ACB8BCC1_9AGAM|nr:hypothetical protein BV22DRAFT_1036440 [Leucogyrophana mollusca]
MSLSSLLLGPKAAGKLKALDTDLDALFGPQVHAAPVANAILASPKSEKKRKPTKSSDEPSGKRTKVDSDTMPVISESPAKLKAKVQKGRGSQLIAKEDDPDGERSDVSKPSVAVLKDAVTQSESDTDGDPSSLVHQSLRKDGSVRGKRSSGHKEKYIPHGETPDQRNARTIFIGNLSAEVAQKRPLQKQLQRHILSHVPNAKIESTRFRSVAFQNPTNKLPNDADVPSAKPNTRKHDLDRASSWRDSNPKDDGGKSDEKKFLTPSQKKKIAFINQEFHTSADSVHAYVVFAHPPPNASRPKNLPPLPPTLDPFDAAHLAVEKCNGTIFMERMIRVDAAGKTPLATAPTTVAQHGAVGGDPKLTVFVGNLDFASKEEDLRVFFEGLVSAERGPPTADSSGHDDKPKFWVTRVRIVRDKDTQLGKGFAYVQFADRACVDEILALEESKVKFAKRKLRVQRCKTLPGTSDDNKAASSSSKSPRTIPTPTISQPMSLPKGDPALGTKLAHLSKEERKQVKSSDADRLARRLAKKKARMALAKQGVAVQGKDRERVRKSTSIKKSQGLPRRESKGRVRSEKSAAKRNHKK